MHVRDRAAIVIFLVVSILFTLPVLQNFDHWGRWDWDINTFITAVPRSTILEYHQLPLWNPYYCGGNVMLANPLSNFLSPFFIFVLVFGAIAGLKLQIVSHLFFGMVGMYFLSRHLRLEKYSSFLPSFVYMLSGVYAMNLTVGHITWRPMAWLPFLFLYYLKSLESKGLKNVVITSLFLCLIFFESGPYLFPFAVLFLLIYSGLSSIEKKSIKPIKNLILIGVFFLLIGAVKFIPVVEFLWGQTPDMEEIVGSQPTSIETLGESLLSRGQLDKHNSVVFYTTENFPWAWHAYGAYIGVIPLILFIGGVAIFYKRRLALVLTSVIFLLVALGDSSPINLWGVLNSMPIFSAIHGPSRLILLFVFCAAPLGGMALSEVEKKKKKWVIPIILLVLFDLILVNSPIFSTAFAGKPFEEGDVSRMDFVQIVTPDGFHDTYTNFLYGVGTVNCYERLSLPKNAVPRGFPEYQGETHLVFGEGNAQISYFSPNRVVVDVHTDKENILVLNQNYHGGWKVKGKKVESFQGLISTKVTPADTKVTFYYLPSSFLVGSAITLLTISFFIFSWHKGGRNDRQ
jgi:hypothetical protein